MAKRRNHFLGIALICAAFPLLGSECSPDPGPSPTPGPNGAVQLRPEDFCKEKGQHVDLEGYCICEAKDTRYEKESGNCIQCVAECTNKECGRDGCQGDCGECPKGQSCKDGTCAPCTPQCDGKACGDDTCGGTCGTCSNGEQCDENQCIPESTGPKIITPCNCNPPPFGAYPGAYRTATMCPQGIAQFQLCDSPCAFGGQQWKEVCVDGLECGTVVQSCNCAYTQAYPGLVVDAPMCSSGQATILQCNFYCSGGGVAWGAVCSCP